MGYPDAVAPSGSLGDASPKLEAACPPTVCSLRDRLLREARHERQRCLEVAEAAENRRVAFRGVTHASCQTEPVTFASDASNAHSTELSLVSVPSRRASCPAIADAGFDVKPSYRDEDEEQMEAIRTLMKQHETCSKTDIVEARAIELSGQVQNERKQLERATSQAVAECQAKEAVHQQVICLETELDNREAQLQVANDSLALRCSQLEQALMQIQAQNSQLDIKDRHIAHLHSMLRSCGICLEDGSTACGSERTFSTGSSRGRLSAF